MKYFGLFLFCLGFVSCSSVGFTNEDAGHSVLASNVSVPANGEVIYRVSRNPRVGADAKQWSEDMGVSRSYFSWFGFKKDAGTAKTYGGKSGS